MEKALAPFLCKDLIHLCATFVYDELSAARAGNLRVLRLSLDSGGFKEPVLQIAKEAIRGKHLSVLKWLKTKLKRMSLDDKLELLNWTAYEMGHLKWIQFLDQTLRLSPRHYEYVPYILAEKGHLKALNYLTSKNEIFLSWNTLLQHALDGHQLKVVKWIALTRSKDILLGDMTFNRLFDLSEQEKIVNWCIDHFRPINKSEILHLLVKDGNLHRIQRACIDFNLLPNMEHFEQAIVGGHLKVLKWFQEINPAIKVEVNKGAYLIRSLRKSTPVAFGFDLSYLNRAAI